MLMLGGFNSVVASEELSGILIDHKLLFENYLLNSVKILKLHERIVCKGHFSSFEELLSKEKSVTVYQKSLQTLATEMYEILNGFSSDIMQNIFKIKSNYYNTLNAPAFSSRNIKTARYGLQTNPFRDLVPKR